MDPYRVARETNPARLPRDLGMSGLGMVLLLGSILATALGLLLTGAARHVASVETLVGVGLVVRGALGALAGRRLVHGDPGALAAVRVAGGAALVHAVLVLAIAAHPFGGVVPVPALVGLLVAWPCVYLAASQRSAVRARWASDVTRAPAAPETHSVERGLVPRDLGLDGVGAVAFALLLLGGAAVAGAAADSLLTESAGDLSGLVAGVAIATIVFGGRGLCHAGVVRAARSHAVAAFTSRVLLYQVVGGVMGVILFFLALSASLFNALAAALIVTGWPLALGMFARRVRARLAATPEIAIAPSEDGGASALGYLLLGVTVPWAALACLPGAHALPGAAALPFVAIAASAVAGGCAALGARFRRLALGAFAVVAIVASAVEMIERTLPASAIGDPFTGLARAVVAVGPVGLAIAALVTARRIDEKRPR